MLAGSVVIGVGQAAKWKAGFIIPISGATTAKRVVENVRVVTLGQSDLKEIDRIPKSTVILGSRYGVLRLKRPMGEDDC